MEISAKLRPFKYDGYVTGTAITVIAVYTKQSTRRVLGVWRQTRLFRFTNIFRVFLRRRVIYSVPYLTGGDRKI